MNKDLKEIYESALESINPYNAVWDYLENNPVNNKMYDNIYVVGCGKGVMPMAKAIEETFLDAITEGVVVTKKGHLIEEDLFKIDVVEGSHPVPDENSVEGAKKVLEILEKAKENDLVISLISGGGSALWSMPAGNISLNDKRKVSELLLNSGASIHEMNCLRKHLSDIKGGRASVYAYPATVLSLVVSDVIGDDLDVISSGPFFPDSTTFEDAKGIIEKYNLEQKLPESILGHIKKGLVREIEDTPKAGHKAFDKVKNEIISSSKIAVQSGAEKASELGYELIFWPGYIYGECRDAAQNFAMRVLRLSSGIKDCKICVIGGGETTVTIEKEGGLGGRNQEFAMVSAWIIADTDNISIASIGTDGNDGPTDAAGAWCDGKTIAVSEEKGLDYADELARHNSYNFFNKTGNLIKTGPTNTNVADIQIGLIVE